MYSCMIDRLSTCVHFYFSFDTKVHIYCGKLFEHSFHLMIVCGVHHATYAVEVCCLSPLFSNVSTSSLSGLPEQTTVSMACTTFLLQRISEILSGN